MKGLNAVFSQCSFPQIRIVYALAAIVSVYLLARSSSRPLVLEKKATYDRYDTDLELIVKRVKQSNRTELLNADSQVEKMPLTIVTALYEINRAERPASAYLPWLEKTLTLNAPFVIFTTAKLKPAIRKLVPAHKKCQIIILELEESPYHQDLEEIESILASGEYKRKMQAPFRIECTNPFYSIVIYSKFTFLEIASILNAFGSKTFIWADAGISRFLAGINSSVDLTGERLVEDKFSIILERTLRRFFESKKFSSLAFSSSNYAQAGMMGGNRLSVSQVARQIRLEWRSLLKNKAVNNEQIAIYLCFLRNPKLFHVLESFSWNELVKFLQ